MKEVGNWPEGLLMNDWLLWLGVDMAIDLAYGRETTHLKDGKTSDMIETLCGASFASLLVQLSKKIPAIALLAPFFVPFRIARAIPSIFRANKAEVQARIDRRGKTKHPDFMDFMISPEDPPPTDKKQLLHIEQVAFQLFILGFDPLQVCSPKKIPLVGVPC